MYQSNTEQFVGEDGLSTVSSLHSTQQCALIYLLELMKADSEAAKKEADSHISN
jgi:hypothetical protein